MGKHINKKLRKHIYKQMLAQTLVWAAGAGTISLAWLGLVAGKVAGLGCAGKAIWKYALY